MDIEKQLLADHSRQNTDRIIRWVGRDPKRLAEVMSVFLGREDVLVQRCAWIVGIVGEHHPAMLQPWVGKMLRKMQEPDVHDAVRRNVVRALQFMDIPPRQLGTVTAVCFDALSSGDCPVAVKVFAMTVLARIVEREPDLEREFRLVIEQQLPYASGAFRSRARHVLGSLPQHESSLPPGAIDLPA